MSEHVVVWRVRVPEGSVEQLLEIEPVAIAEAQRLCSDLIGAELVDLGGGTWLHVLRWGRPDGPKRLMRHADRFDAVSKMHALMEDGERIGQCEIVASTN